MRRRHGIPDDDHRPFNVAYAAALQSRKRKEGKNNGGTQRSAPPVTVEDEVPQTIGATTGHFPLPSYAGASAGHEDGIRLGESSAFAGPSVLSVAQSSASHYGSTSQATVRYPPLGRHNVAPPAHHGKHALDDEVDARHESSAKKSRLEVEELLDGGDVSERQVNGMDVDQHTGHIKRGSKRVASLEDDEGLDASRVDRRDKRARKVSIDKSAIAEDYDMEDDEQEDELDGNPSIVRGKKRDRAEAGSTFGGDDSVIDDDEKPQRQRRRRTVSNKLSQSSSRGQKRVRDLDSYDSDDSADRLKREHTRKKRGKRSEEEEVPVSHDPLCKGRHIGEEWESNGIRYKVGPNGQRLRQELVKKSRSRFPMPSDSQHPDRRANVDVYVETWLTEEEYQAAKERHELAWQDSSLSPEPHTQLDVPDSPTKAGKNLLWSSTMSSRESPAKRGALRQSIGPGANLRLSILSPAPVSTSRLISSVYQAPASPASDSPKLQKTKSYSKWEKQDLEAAAMSKIREKQQQQQQAKATSFPAASSTPNPGFFGATATPATAAKPAETSSQPSAPSFSFAPASTSGSANKSATEPPKLNVPTSAPASAPSGQSKPAAPLFPFPSSTGSGSTSTPSAVAPTPPTQTQPAAAKSDAQSASSIPNFFAKPAAPASAPAPPTVPNFFAKPATQTTSSGGAPTAGSQAPAAPKTAFSFAPTTAPTQPQANGSPVSNGSAKPEEAKQVPGGSLLSRLGMGPHPAAQAQVPAATTFSFGKPASSTPGAASGATTDAAKSATTTPASGSSAPGNAAPEPLKFSFGAPSKSATPAPAANGTTSTASTTAGTTSAATSAPKFSFGVTGTSAQSGAAGTTAASSPFQTNPANASNTNVTNASSAPKSAFSIGNSSAPAASPFAGNAGASNSSPFGAPAGNSSSTTKASPFGAPSSGNQPSSFGAPSGTASSTTNASPFGAPSSGNQPSPFGAPSGTASTNNASSFGAPSGTAAAGGSSPFGAPTATAASTNNASPFGTPSTTNNASPFGTTTGPNPSPFGSIASGAAKPAEAPKSAFSFGAPTSASNTSAKPAEAPKSAFAFGTTNGPSSGSIFGGNTTQNSSAPKADTKPTPTFGTPSTSTPTFGAPSSTPTFGASSSAPIFGSPANASGINGKPAFSFGASNTTASSPFGGASTTDNKTDSKPSFGFGTSNNATSAGNSTAAPASPFSFGAQASSNNATTPAASSPFGNTQQGSSSFSFGAPSGAFSFGSSSNANQTTQK
ncbi:hypothetical protein BN946_scf184908.g115 [Trametes cinnabarina]|uniref:Uncharacterized protein n=1 Tax=Pycnoporus cinnabarinus TaxID=5643 RepID=A0A060SA53_PYCCI|nr:hypothetical protein BN946_scf184908.g115 [Trametes cinnabarina]